MTRASGIFLVRSIFAASLFGLIFAQAAGADTAASLYEIYIDDSTELADILEPAISLDIETLAHSPINGLSTIVFGTPTLVNTPQGPGMRLDSIDAGRFYEQIRFNLGVMNTYGEHENCSEEFEDESIFVDELDEEIAGYNIEIDFVVQGLSFFGSNRDFAIYLDGVRELTRIDFTADGHVRLYDGDPMDLVDLGTYPVGKPVKLEIEYDFSRTRMSLTLNDQEIHREESGKLNLDLNAVRFSLGVGRAIPAPRVTIHSVRVDTIDL